jgi:hypothetical protein
MPEEENRYDWYVSAIALLDEMRSWSMDTEHWSNMLKTAFADNDVGALNMVIGHLRRRIAAHPGGPAAAVPNAHVPASAPPASGRRTRLQQSIQLLQLRFRFHSTRLFGSASSVRPCPFGFIAAT